MKAVTIVAGSLALVLCIGTNAFADSKPGSGIATQTGTRGAKSGDPATPGSCKGAFEGSAEGSVVKTTTAGPNNSIVSPGEKITVTLKWDKKDFGWTGPATTEDCVEIGSRIIKLSQEHKPAPLTGTDTFSYVVPAGAPAGSRSATAGGVGYGAKGGGWSDGDGQGRGDDDGYGHNDAHRAGSGGSSEGSGDDGVGPDGRGHGDDGPETSAVLCYTVAPDPVAPEAPMALLFPVAGLLIGGTAYAIARRRRAATALHHAGGLSLSLRSGRHAAARGSSGPSRPR